MIHGRNLILAIGGAPIAGARGCSVDRDTDTIEVCSPTDGAARTYIPSTTGWSASANGLYATTEKANILRQIWRNYQNGITTPIEIQYTTGNQVEHGTAILTSLQESGEVGGLMKFSIKLQGSGKMTAETYTEVTMEQESEYSVATLEPGIYDVYSPNGTMVLYKYGTQEEYDRVEDDTERLTITEKVKAAAHTGENPRIVKVVIS